MKLKLTNFRCHGDREIDLPDKGLVLLSGPSGCGKTTVLNAFAYALYGKLKGQGVVYAHDKKTARVALTGYRVAGCRLDIVRSAPGNRVRVVRRDAHGAQQVYEEAAAQGVIDAAVSMDHASFCLSSYVVQRLESSILSLPPRDQVRFIKTLAFVGDCDDAYRARVKEKIRMCDTKAQYFSGELAAARRAVAAVAADHGRPVPPVALPPGVGEAELRALVAEAPQELEALRAEIARLEAWHRECVGAAAAADKVKALEARAAELDARIRKLPEGAQSADISALEAAVAAARAATAYATKLALVESLVAAHRRDQAARLAELTVGLLAAPARAALAGDAAKLREKCGREDAACQKVAEAKEAAKALAGDVTAAFPAFKAKSLAKPSGRSLRDLTAFLESQAKRTAAMLDQHRAALAACAKAAAVLEVRGKTYVCPGCQASLVLGDAGLGLAEPGPDDPAPDLPGSLRECAETEQAEHEAIARLEADLARLAVLRGRRDGVGAAAKHRCLSAAKLAQLKAKLGRDAAKHTAAEARAADHAAAATAVDSGALPPALAEQVQGLRALAPGPESWTHALSVEKLEEAAATKSARLAELQHAQRERRDLESARERVTQKLKVLAAPAAAAADAGAAEAALRKADRAAREASDAARETQALYSQWRERRDYEAREGRKQQLLRDKAASAANLAAVQNKALGYAGLAEVCRKADNVATANSIAVINKNATVYTERMFDDAISVRLVRHKTTKKGERRFKLNTEVMYKGSNYASLDQLSGGERQRCNLAFILAVNDVVGSPVLLLDECLNNLDGQTNSDILLFLKGVCAEKLILVVAHEALKANFDAVVDV
uniref:Chromosome segregation ATPase n=1 Tax=Marseillevirus LCMAC103 TaxID=2506604 RepID=A0A481YV65_9VIRU|nr:MAG: chromosome segregation ATPase [Marseillevirus LCMAC103]